MAEEPVVRADGGRQGAGSRPFMPRAAGRWWPMGWPTTGRFRRSYFPDFEADRGSAACALICAPMKGRDFSRTQRPAQDDLRYRPFLPHRPCSCTNASSRPHRQNTPGEAPHTFNCWTFTPSRFAGTSRTWKSTCRGAIGLCSSGDGLRGPGRRAADHVLRHGQRAARDADGMVLQFARYWKEQTGQYPRSAVRFAGHHLCGLEPLERGPRRLHHHSAAWVEHACTGETSAGRILAAMAKSPRPRANVGSVRYVIELGQPGRLPGRRASTHRHRPGA